MKIHELHPDDRPREKMLSLGAENLSRTELLSLVIRSGIPKVNAMEVSAKLLESAGNSLQRLSTMKPSALMKIDGVGEAKALSLAAAFELGRRVSMEASSPSGVFRSSTQIFEYMIPRLRGLDHEELWVVYLTRSNQMIDRELLNKGNLESVGVDIPSITKHALERSAHRVILCHNHPGGSVIPSREDIEMTRAVRNALKVVGLEILDHLVVFDDRFFSFSENKVTVIGV